MTLCTDTGIGYDRSGPYGGTTVVLLHAGVADRRMWEPQWTALTRQYDVVRLDLRGFGGSVARPEGPFAHHEDVAQTLSALGVERAHLSAARWGPASRSTWPWPARSWSRRCYSSRPAKFPDRRDDAELRHFVDAENEAMHRGDVDAAVAANLDWWFDRSAPGCHEKRSEIRALVVVMQRRAFELTADWDDVEEVELAPPALDRLADSTSRPGADRGTATWMPSASRGRLSRPGSPRCAAVGVAGHGTPALPRTPRGLPGAARRVARRRQVSAP